jgi:hypothetical protein
MSDKVIWEGQKNDLTNLASSGKLVGGHYQVTDRFIIISSGLLASTTEQIPLYSVANMQVKQSIVQKARNVGDVIFTLDEDQTGTRTFESISDPKSLINLLNPHVKAARDRRSFGQGEVGGGALISGASLTPGGIPIVGQQDMISQLARLGQLRDTNLLTEAEFEKAKAKILNGE